MFDSNICNKRIAQPTLVCSHGDAFRRSSPCNLPPHRKATPTAHLAETASGSDHPSGTISSGSSAPRVFSTNASYVGLVVYYVLLRKRLPTIPSIILVPDNTALAWDHPRRVHLRIAWHYERKSNGWTVKHPWNGPRR